MSVSIPPPADDSAHGAYVLKLARMLIDNKQAHGWSHALEQARKLAATPATKKAR